MKKKIVVSIIYKCLYLWGLVLSQKYMMSVFLLFFFVYVFLAGLCVVMNIFVSCEQRKLKPAVTVSGDSQSLLMCKWHSSNTRIG